MTAAHSDASKAICAQIDEMTQGKKGHRLLMLDSFIFFMTCLMDRDSKNTQDGKFWHAQNVHILT